MITDPTPQRALRSHLPARPRPQVLHSADHLAVLVARLMPRDRWLIRMLFEHRVLTTDQIVQLCFRGHRTANQRLRLLYEWGVVARFQPHRTVGSNPLHYVLDTAGALVLAHEHGTDLKTLGYSRETELGRAYSLQLAHTVGCNSLLASLVHHARQPGAAGQLSTWWSAARCASVWGDIVTPDAYARWDEAGTTVEWFLEFDFGTERLARIAAKLPRYARLATATGIITPLLVWLPSARREATVRTAFVDTMRGLDHRLVPVATTSPEACADAVDMNLPRWQSLAGGDRVRLADLPSLWPELPPPASSPVSSSGPKLVAAPPPMPPTADGT
ncbi:replication-relaxation family protein [Kutzneria buriramensis]|uniref:Protein involved in plasmid replication-relaxation n=1 Tax=Kutzneria buriramensis TaxID=1045776 RepID=A0A3E0GWG7_9PSEU|nr:replication-relaxation family protein [Kutzneria buriramensis]REH28657.1 protein involved in plasmid replication-relaxation [Kutzneria buriramensis]